MEKPKPPQWPAGLGDGAEGSPHAQTTPSWAAVVALGRARAAAGWDGLDNAPAQHLSPSLSLSGSLGHQGGSSGKSVASGSWCSAQSTEEKHYFCWLSKGAVMSMEGNCLQVVGALLLAFIGWTYCRKGLSNVTDTFKILLSSLKK